MKIKRLKTKVKAAEVKPVAARKTAKAPARAMDATALPIDGEGPWKVPQGRGADMLATQTGTYAPVLDFGSMLWLWELAEAKCLAQYKRHGDSIPPLNAGVTAGLRAVEALRQAAVEGQEALI